jgi:hypothetical protein
MGVSVIHLPLGSLFGEKKLLGPVYNCFTELYCTEIGILQGLLVFCFYNSYIFLQLKGSPSAAVKLLLCDHEVIGSSLGNNLLQKCKERLRT